MDEQIKPFGVWIEATMRNGEPHAYFERDTDFPRRLVEYGSKAECTYVYSQQSIDALRADYERAEGLALRSIEMRMAMEAEAEALRAEVARLNAACNQWSERERLFGAHEDLLARAVALRADAERYRWLRDFNSGGDVAELVDQNWNDDLDAAIDAARKGAE